MSDTTVIKKGSLFTLAAGEYSDYEIYTLCKATTDINVIALRDEYLALYPAQKVDYHFEEYQFVKWLIVDKKVCKELEYFEWFLGAYSIVNFGVDKRGKGAEE